MGGFKQMLKNAQLQQKISTYAEAVVGRNVFCSIPLQALLCSVVSLTVLFRVYASQ